MASGKGETKLGQFDHDPVKYELAAMNETATGGGGNESEKNPNYVKDNNKQTNTKFFGLKSAINLKAAHESSKDDCSINWPLVPLKMTLFCWYAAGACLLPYMTLHMKDLGLTMMELAIIYITLPITQLLAQPIAGFMADRLGNYKIVLLLCLGTCMITTSIIQILPGRSPASRAPSSDEYTDGTGNNSGNTSSLAATIGLLTFWVYLIVRIFHQVAVGFTYVLLDSTALVLTEEHDSTYGRQRLWAILATGVFSPICGWVMDAASTEPGKINNFAPAFYFFNVLTALTFLITTLITIRVNEPPRDVWKNVKQLIKSPGIWVFLCAVLIMGSCWGFLESYLFLHLQELNAPKYMMGLTLTVGALIGVPFLGKSDWFVEKFGAVNLIILALVFYFIRLVGYSLIYNPWLCIPFEMMEAFTLHLMWVATVRLAYLQSPPGMISTVQAIIGGLNWSVGRGFGALVGGSSYTLYGARVAFRVMGTMALAMAIIYATCHYCCLADIEKTALDRKRRPSDNSDDIESSTTSRKFRSGSSSSEDGDLAQNNVPAISIKA